MNEVNSLNLLVALAIILIIVILMSTKTVVTRLDVMVDALKRVDTEVDAVAGL